MSSTPYFLYCVLTFLALFHQTHGQTCSADLDYVCVNTTAFEYCLDGSVVSDFPAQSCGELYCYDGCENICAASEADCVSVTSATTTTESSSTTMPTTTTTETTTELTTEATSTTETTTTELATTTIPTTTTTETTTELTTEATSTTETTTTEVTTTTMPTTETTTELTTEETSTTETTTTELTTTTMPTTETTTELTTEETSTTELTKITTTKLTTTAATDITPTEPPFTCESAGEFQDLWNCTNFYLCIPLSSGDFVYIMFSCPDGSQFDSVTKKCSQNATCVTPSCNDYGFFCISTSEVQLCYDSSPPSGDIYTCPTNTYCSMDCQYPCWADMPCSVSTTALPTSTVTLLPTTTESPSTSTTALPTSTVTIPETTTAAPFVCTEAGRFPDPANCSLYYVCSPKSSGGFYTLHFSCPTSSVYSPSIRQCSYYYTCSSAKSVDYASSTVSTTVTTTSSPFTCVESGRFADPEDCSSYYVCSAKSSGGFYELHYQCPPTSAFNENTLQCSTSVTC